MTAVRPFLAHGEEALTQKACQDENMVSHCYCEYSGFSSSAEEVVLESYADPPASLLL